MPKDSGISCVTIKIIWFDFVMIFKQWTSSNSTSDPQNLTRNLDRQIVPSSSCMIQISILGSLKILQIGVTIGHQINHIPCLLSCRNVVLAYMVIMDLGFTYYVQHSNNLRALCALQSQSKRRESKNALFTLNVKIFLNLHFLKEEYLLNLAIAEVSLFPSLFFL